MAVPTDNGDQVSDRSCRQQKKKQNYGRIDLSLDNILNWSLWTPMDGKDVFYRKVISFIKVNVSDSLLLLLIIQLSLNASRR